MTAPFAPDAWLFWMFLGLLLGVVFGVSGWVVATTLVSYDKRSPVPMQRNLKPCWCHECVEHRSDVVRALLHAEHRQRFAEVSRLINLGLLDPPHDRLGHVRRTQRDAWEESDA